MPTPEVEEFALALVRHVRDAAIRDFDVVLDPGGTSPMTKRCLAVVDKPSKLGEVIADAIDVTVFSMLRAIDEGALRLQYIAENGRAVELTEEGRGELGGWYMGSGGWRAMFSQQRYIDDFADMV